MAAQQETHDVKLGVAADNSVSVVATADVHLHHSDNITWNAVGASMVVNVQADIFTKPVKNVTIPKGGSLTRKIKSRVARRSYKYTVSSNGNQPNKPPKIIID